MPDEETNDTATVNWVPAPGGVIEIYANMATVQWSLDDVRVRIAQMINSPDTPNPGTPVKAMAQERAAITMTWRNAKIIADNLTKAVALYEKANGEIQIDVKLPKFGE